MASLCSRPGISLEGKGGSDPVAGFGEKGTRGADIYAGATAEGRRGGLSGGERRFGDGKRGEEGAVVAHDERFREVERESIRDAEGG